MSTFETRMAATEAEEVRAWKCASCDTMVEAEGRHCRSCAQYWADVEAGLFDELDEAADEDDDEYEDCGLMPDGQCTRAGSEECDWMCGALDRDDAE